MTLSRQVAQDMQEVCVALCEYLQITPPFKALELKERIATDQRCPIFAIAKWLPGTVYGVCAHLREGYAILYRDDGSEAQRERIIFHELGHIVLGHLRQPEQVLVLREGLTNTTEEHEAEAFAEFMTKYALLGRATTPPDRAGAKAPTGKKSPFGRWMQKVTR